jgi:cyclase
VPGGPLWAGDPGPVWVNTHHHGDHTNGNYLAGVATIIGHRSTRELMIATGIDHYEQAFEGIDWGEPARSADR